MQTFLPYASFDRSAKALDLKRLNKQRIEVLQIMRTLRDGVGWAHHPATLMWKGYGEALRRYGVAMCDEWRTRRGITEPDQITTLILRLEWHTPESPNDPPWIGDTLFHSAHRSALLRKEREHYVAQGWGEPDDLAYTWPVLDPAVPEGYYLRLSKPDEKRIKAGELIDPFAWQTAQRRAVRR